MLLRMDRGDQNQLERRNVNPMNNHKGSYSWSHLQVYMVYFGIVPGRLVSRYSQELHKRREAAPRSDPTSTNMR